MSLPGAIIVGASAIAVAPAVGAAGLGALGFTTAGVAAGRLIDTRRGS
jgi:hypothetical protein